MASTVWRGHLTFGLVSLPVRLYSAARGEIGEFQPAARQRQLAHQTDHSIARRRTSLCRAANWSKGYEYEKDRYVVIEEEDIKKVAPKTAKVMEILEFVKGDQVDPIYLESSYYMAPDEGGEKPYALLFEALRQVNYYALAKIAMHNREHIVILRPGKKGILLHTMYYRTRSGRWTNSARTRSLVKPNELAMANMLIETLKAEFEPEKYHDTYRDNLLQMIEAKKEGQVVVETPEPHVAPVIDIMEALKRSLAEKKKPVQAATAAAGEAQEETASEPVTKKRARSKAV
jgi:DNA end-binding protein Ku